MKVLGGETNLNAPISVGSARVVRVFNSDSSNLLVTRKTSGGTTIGTFLVPAGKVVYCEKDYTDTLEGGENLKVTHVAFSPMMSFALMSSADPVPSYTHSVSTTSVDEGGNFTTTISTTNVDDGTNLYWELTGVQSSDFSSGALTGTATISSNSATFSHTVDEDLTTEGTETATIKVYSDSGRTEQVGNTLTVTIADTSTTPVADFSVDFPGTGALSWPWNSSSMDWGASESITIEFYIKMDVISGNYMSVINRWGSSKYSFGVDILGNGKIFFYEGNGGSALSTHTSSIAISTNRWYHIAIVKDGTQGKFFIDGAGAGTFGWNRASNNSTQPLHIGNLGDGNSYFMNGKVSNARVVIGTALYTSDFSPSSTTLTNVSNTKFLACQTSNPNEATVVNNGNASDSATSVGNPASSTEDPFEGNYSVDFAGSPDHLLIDDSTDFDLASVDFTMECWYYPRSNPTWVGLISQWPNQGYNTTNSWTLEPVGTGLNFYYCMTNGTLDNIVAPGSIQTNQWQHCAISKKNNQLKVFLNGSGSSWTTIDGTMQNSTEPLTIGGYVAPSQGSGWANGLISNVRITKGECVYENNFTPPTAPLTTTSQDVTSSNVKLLCCNKSILLYADVTPNDIDIGDGSPIPTDTNPF